MIGLDCVLWFGKHKGALLCNVIDEDAQYVRWCVEQGIFDLDIDAESYLQEFCSDDYEERINYGR